MTQKTETAQLDKIYTADEAAKRLRLTNRGVIKLAKQHGMCSRVGRNFLFSETDLLALWDVIREPAKQPKSPAVKPALSGLRLRESLRKLTAKKKATAHKRQVRT